MLSSGKHRRASKAVRLAALAGVAGTAIAVPLIGATSASAASVATWDRSPSASPAATGRINTGNGFYGGLQFSKSSWEAAGGTKYAARADLATKAQQIAIAEKLLAIQGPGAWSCASAGGLTAGGPAPDINPDGSASPEPHRSSTPASTEAKKAPRPRAGRLARDRRASQGPRRLHRPCPATPSPRSPRRTTSTAAGSRSSRLNKDTVKDADLIYPGQHLAPRLTPGPRARGGPRSPRTARPGAPSPSAPAGSAGPDRPRRPGPRPDRAYRDPPAGACRPLRLGYGFRPTGRADGGRTSPRRLGSSRKRRETSRRRHTCRPSTSS